MHLYEKPQIRNEEPLLFLFIKKKKEDSKGYKSPHHEGRVKDVVLEGEQCESHVGEDEVFCQEIQKFEQLKEENKLRES